MIDGNADRAASGRGRSKVMTGLGIGALCVVGLLAIGAWQLGLFTAEPDEANLSDAIALETAADAEAEADATSIDDDPAGMEEDDGPAATVDPLETPTSAPPRPTAEAASPEPDATKAPATEGEAPAAATGPISTSADLAGRWQVKQSEATYVGYRIDEILSGVEFTAVGRTTGVEGTLDADESSIFSVDIVADLAGLTSDNRARDGQLKTQALETNKFPDARFTMTKSIPLNDLPSDGEALDFNAIGDLTIHGVTRPVDIPIQATIVDEQLFVVGSTEVLLADYDIETPSAPIVAGVSEFAIMELSLVFAR